MAINQDKQQSTTKILIYSIVSPVFITLLSLFLGEQPIPFYSAAFVFGASSIFFFSVTYGSTVAISQAAGVLTLLLLLNVSAGTSVNVIAVQGPLLIFFFFLLAILPNVAPFILKADIEKLEKENATLTQKVEKLHETNQKEHKENVAQKSVGNKKLAAKLSSRNTLLITYARGLLQCGSVREIINLLFYNISKAFVPQQCAMLIKSPGKDEFIIGRIIHKEHEKLENQKITELSPPLKSTIQNKKPIKLPVKTPLTDDIDTEFIVPVLLNKEIHAIFSICGTKDGNLSEDDVNFIEVLGELTSGAANQLTVVTSRKS